MHLLPFKRQKITMPWVGVHNPFSPFFLACQQLGSNLPWMLESDLPYPLLLFLPLFNSQPSPTHANRIMSRQNLFISGIPIRGLKPIFFSILYHGSLKFFEIFLTGNLKYSRFLSFEYPKSDICIYIVPD